jgi:pantoate--beta-alanine ligase
MRIVRTVAEVRAALADPRAASVGLVPTMGALHAGHLSLIERARRDCATVVVSLFVNPTQFGAGEDLTRYPRDEAADAALAAEAGADLLFAPAVEEIYPAGFATTVRVGGLAETLEGAARPGHFDGVATVVVKLLTIVAPDRAYFGAKDAQQLAVVRRAAADLDLPVAIESVPTAREHDGLALSSRNAYLSAEDRRRALALSRGLRAAETLHRGGERDAASLRSTVRHQLDADGIAADYVAIVDPSSFEPLGAARAPRRGHRRARPRRRPRRAGAADRQPPAPPRIDLPPPLPSLSRRDPVQRVMLGSKLHRATVTGCDLHSVGADA